ncbi:MAG: M28 family peptidase [Planctomycetaceae bacterium]|jgi:aminopeptidase YwaD|nr:M28 family peptidase [Planctomycetaceae bacterium]MBT6154563.1 M28 family peptidase [Planctomycetaceae bacterium]MBT6486593.1 M28 family peptidase [Planctomycetaceae bacterium]MBT6494467.1 M28 family peptidase [Planctomycetaceae bacterium]
MNAETEQLWQHVVQLASTPRPRNSDALKTARRYVTECFEQAGWSVERHSFTSDVGSGQQLAGVNLVARHADFRAENRPRFCVGAHLDSCTETPGADDNASAVAALLEIARLLPSCRPDDMSVELELVAFDLEENGMLGGAEHARLMREQQVDLCGMVSLEMLGYCDHQPGSQQLLPQLAGMYSDTADFIAVVGNQISQPLIDRFVSGLKQVPGLPVESLAVPDNGLPLLPTRLSDHSPFWDAGYAALMVTDTSFLRNPHYHLPSDTPETLDMEFLTKVTEGCLQAVRTIVAEGV